MLINLTVFFMKIKCTGVVQETDDLRLCPQDNFVWDGQSGRCREVVCADGYEFDETYTTCVQKDSQKEEEVRGEGRGQEEVVCADWQRTFSRGNGSPMLVARPLIVRNSREQSSPRGQATRSRENSLRKRAE